MWNVKIRLADRPGGLAVIGEALAAAALSIEGGGVFATGDGSALANFLVADGDRARAALTAAGLDVVEVRAVLIQRLQQAVPGQLGKLARRMADAGVNIDVQYSDHDHQLILVVDDLERGRAVSDAWRAEHAQR